MNWKEFPLSLSKRFCLVFIITFLTKKLPRKKPTKQSDKSKKKEDKSQEEKKKVKKQEQKKMLLEFDDLLKAKESFLDIKNIYWLEAKNIDTIVDNIVNNCNNGYGLLETLKIVAKEFGNIFTHIRGTVLLFEGELIIPLKNLSIVNDNADHYFEEVQKMVIEEEKTLLETVKSIYNTMTLNLRRYDNFLIHIVAIFNHYYHPGDEKVTKLNSY
jgi:hypothetical protein